MKVFYLGPESRIQKHLALAPWESELKELPKVDVIVSYRYRHILPWSLIRPFRGRILNIHTSLLPNQRGAHPIFWAYLEDSLHGVTIHEIDRGVDTGPIIAQIPVFLPETHTFRSAWNKLNETAQDFFISLWPSLLKIEPQPQPIEGGTVHKASELNKYGNPFNWEQCVEDFFSKRSEKEMSDDFWYKYFKEIKEIQQKDLNKASVR